MKIPTPFTVAALSVLVAVSAVHAAPAKNPIKIGALYNLTGGMSSIDTPSLDGAKLKAKEINDAGGLLGGRMIEIISVDTKTDQQASALGAKKVLGDGVVAGIGYGDTTYVMAAAPNFQSKKVPFVTSGATHPELPKWVGDYMFMVPFGDDDQSYAIADYAYDTLNVRTVAVWTDTSMDFTKALARFFKERMVKKGATVTLEDSFKTGDKDFSALIARLKTASPAPDAVFISSIPNEAGITVKQLREAGVTMPVLSGDGFDTELVTSVPGPRLANNVYFSTHTYRADPRPQVQKFIELYTKELGKEPDSAYIPLGYDAVGLIADAITRAGSAEPKAIQKALAETKDYEGVTGKIAYTRANKVPVKPVAIIEVMDGKYTMVETWNPDN